MPWWVWFLMGAMVGSLYGTFMTEWLISRRNR